MPKLKKIEGLEFWPQEKFRGRSIRIYGDGKPGEGELTVIPVPDDEICCDSCNNLITEFPVPVYFGHALCPKCWKEAKKDNKLD